MAKSKENNQTEETVEAEEVVADTVSMLPEISNFNMALITGFGMAIIIIIVMLASDQPTEQTAASPAPVSMAASTSSPAATPTTSTPAATPASTPAATPTSAPAPAAPSVSSGDVNVGGIERKGEGRHFYTTIKIPANAETLYLSGSGAARNEDGTWGDMEAQTIDTFNSFKATLEAEGWSMSDVVQVRAFAVAGEYGLLDFDGFNRGYREFFGTEENPMKPVRSFVQIAGLVVPGWLVEIEIRAARAPQ
jgi:enamine deaminase RidA (YjgF/YER057c/UK114 family)